MTGRNITESDGLGFLAGDGEMSRLMRGHDWSTSTLGPPSAWPESLRAVVSLMLNSKFAMSLSWGPEQTFLYNDSYAELIHRKHPSALGRSFDDVWAEVWDDIAPLVDKAMAGEASYFQSMPLTMNRKGFAEETWWTFSYSPVRDERGQVAGTFNVTHETTDQVLGERRLAAAEASQRRALLQMPGFAAIVSGPDHVYDYVNDAYVKIAERSDFIGRGFKEVFPDIAGQGFFELLDGVYRTGVGVVLRGMELRLHGSVVPQYIDFVFEPIREDDGAVRGVFIGGYEVTEARRAQARRDALIRLTDRLADLDDPTDAEFAAASVLGETLDVARVGYGAIDPDTDMLTVAHDWTARGAETLAGALRLRHYGSFVDDLKRGEFVTISDVAADPRTAAAAAEIHKRGVLSLVNVPVMEKGRLVAMLFVNDDRVREWDDDDLALIREVAARTHTTSQRIRGAAALRASEDNFRTLARAMPNQVWSSPPSGQLDWFNEQVYAFSGAEPGTLDGEDWTRMVHPDDVDGAAGRWSASLASGETYEVEFRLRRGDGAWRWHIARAVPIKSPAGEVIRWIGANTDIHDQKEINATLEERVQERTAQLLHTEEALRQAQKMEAVGQLTGGIAHDFNNLLTGISGSLEMLERRMSQGKLAGVERYIDAAQGAARRAAALTQRLLAFSRRQTLDPKAIDVNRLIAGMEDLIRRTVGPDVTVEVVGAGGLWTTRVDPSQLENALLNLCINARDAMAPDGGRLTIETANKWLDERAARERELPAGQYLSLCVTDTGAGMDPEVQERAFDPFFTTKPLGVGTGLGLSMIYGFVRQSGGQVRIYSEVGKGTTMCLYLPRHAGDVDADPPAELERTAPGHGETVLVIDDEAMVRMLIVDVLEEHGYAALEAVDGPSGMKILDSDARIDLLITDVGLPGGMNGRQVADAARGVRPGLKVLFVTGYAENAVVGNGHLDPGMEVITKPFGTAALGHKIRDMIDRP